MIYSGRDIGGNAGASAPVTVNVIPDPLTTVTGRVLGEMLYGAESIRIDVHPLTPGPTKN